MTKTLSMASHKNYNLSVDESFAILLTSKLITCFIDGFTLIRKSQSTVDLLNGSVYIGFWTLKLKCTRVRETFELNQLKFAPSQIPPIFSRFDQLQTCCHYLDQPISYISFQVPTNLFFIVMTTGQGLWALISKPVFQCSKIMKCNNEGKASHVRHSPNHYKPTTN